MRIAILTSFAAALAGALVFGPAPARAASDNPFNSNEPYEACVAAVGKNAADAYELARTWSAHGGGLPADHCAALALIALDEPGEAASRLNQLAENPNAGPLQERAALLMQSGNAWLLAEQPENAESAFSAALKLTPRDADLWTDRARARAAREDWANAETDLTNALSFKTGAEIYVLRAAARQAQGNQNGYKADIDAALKIDPTFPEALVERGSMKLASGDKAGARADWLQVLLRAPDSPAADVVRRRIETLEVRNP
jgi:tetratricopeptide (TPR) repeat protein